MGKREHARGTSGGSCGGGAQWLVRGYGFRGSFGRCFWSGGDRSPVRGGAGIGLFLDAYQALIRDFPPEMLVLSALLEILFEEDGAARIGHEGAGGRQENIPGAILHLYAAPEKG